MKGTLNVEIKKNAMSVTAAIMPNGTTEITEALIKEELEKRGIKAGIDEEAIREVVTHGRHNKPYCVAKGQPPVRGTDGHYEYFFDKDIKENKPTIREDGSVDYAPHFVMVKKGDVIAKYHPPQNGTFGYTVFAAVVAPPPAKKGETIRCKGVQRRGDKFFAMQNGKVTLKNNVLEVRECLVIKGNAGYEMRKIKFNGDVYVAGDVKSEVIIEAEGNIEVEGVVEAATLIAGGNIVVHQGIHGKENARIEAKGSVTSNFIEEAQVKAAGDIVVDHMVNVKAASDNTICATGKTGQILGGEITAGECVDAMKIGNESEWHTNIRVKSADEEDLERGRIIVRKKAYAGTSIDLNGEVLKNVASLSGEYHVTEDGVQKCAIGAFQYKEKEKKKAEEESKRLFKPLILLVDDDTVHLKLEYKYLNTKYRVAAVSRPHDALAILHKIQPDLILLDYLMPKMNGGELLEQIRAMEDKRAAATPVFFLTSVTDKEIITECLKLYPQGYLIKPLGQEELIKIVDEFFAANDQQA